MQTKDNPEAPKNRSQKAQQFRQVIHSARSDYGRVKARSLKTGAKSEAMALTTKKGKFTLSFEFAGGTPSEVQSVNVIKCVEYLEGVLKFKLELALASEIESEAIASEIESEAIASEIESEAIASRATYDTGTEFKRNGKKTKAPALQS